MGTAIRQTSGMNDPAKDLKKVEAMNQEAGARVGGGIKAAAGILGAFGTAGGAATEAFDLGDTAGKAFDALKEVDRVGAAVGSIADGAISGDPAKIAAGAGETLKAGAKFLPRNTRPSGAAAATAEAGAAKPGLPQVK